ncbi:MAG: hypothetical protein KJ709_00600 [Nanoarchaeota archaeon]|nr:hypothetical protein [Nanoarchaeota archaeon]
MSKGYFYTVDALMAITVLIIGLYFVFFTTSGSPSLQVSKNMAEDVMGTASSTKIFQLNDQAYPILRALKQAGLVPDARSTLLQEAGMLYTIGNVDEATLLFEQTIDPTVPEQYNYAIIINDDVLFERSSITQTNADSLVTSRRVLYGSIDKRDMWGPLPAEVRVWQ